MLKPLDVLASPMGAAETTKSANRWSGVFESGAFWAKAQCTSTSANMSFVRMINRNFEGLENFAPALEGLGETHDKPIQSLQFLV